MRLIREEKAFIREAVLLMLPMILQNFVTFSMSMADTFMVGVLGETALAAVTMANSPFYVMQLMIFGVQSGMSVLVAQYHGRGDQEAINRVMGIALFVSTTITGLLAITAFCIPEQIMRVLTNNADLVAPGAAYTRYVGFSYFFSAISGVYIAAQRSTENPRLGAVLLTVSGALNIFLNWVLIYGKLGAPALGVEGAAIATFISQLVGGVLPVFYFIDRSNSSRLHLCKTSFYSKVLRDACINGSSELMTNLSMSLVNILYNYQLLRLAGENGVAAYGVIMYAAFLFVAVFVGYAVGSAPIVSFHYGARNHAEVHNLYRKSLRLIAVVAVTLTLASMFIIPCVARIFVGYDAELLALTSRAFRLYALSFLIMGFNVYASSFFTALGDGVTSALISFLRTLAFQVIAILLLPLLLGIDGIWLAVTAAELAALAVSAAMLLTKDKVFHYRKV